MQGNSTCFYKDQFSFKATFYQCTSAQEKLKTGRCVPCLQIWEWQMQIQVLFGSTGKGLASSSSKKKPFLAYVTKGRNLDSKEPLLA